MHCYYVYILTNPRKTVLYIGMTNDLARRLAEHREQAGQYNTFTGRYNCSHLIYYEVFDDVNLAYEREKQLKKWSRVKKERLISTSNPSWHDLNLNFRL